MGLSPMAPMQSQRNWSEISRMMLGRSPRAAVCAGAAASGARAAGTVCSHERRVTSPDELVVWLTS